MESTVPTEKGSPNVFQGTINPAVPTTAEPARKNLIRTMGSDMAEAIKKQKETAVSIALAEEEKKKAIRAEALSKQSAVANVAPKPIGRVVVVIIILLIVALLGAGYVFVLPKISSIQLPKISLPSFPSTTKPSDTPAVPALVRLAPSLIPAQSEKRISINGETPSQLFSTITTERGNGTPAGSIKNLYITEDQGSGPTPITAERLFAFENIRTSDLLERSLDKQFMAGFFGESNGGATPFLILKVSDHDAALAGMLDWESGLPGFFDTLFGARYTNDIDIKFRDVVTLGKNVRSFDTPYGIRVAYAFVDQNTIVIAGSRSALEAILALASSK